MKIALLYSLLIYQFLPHCDATASCRPLSEVRAASFGDSIATTPKHAGSSENIYSRVDYCNDPSNSNYVLLHLNHRTGELDFVLQQQDPKFTILNIQLNTSGIYCTYKQCAPQGREQCCTRIIVTPPEVEIILPDHVSNNVQERARGVCFAKTWPLLTANDMNVLTDDNCTIAKFPFNIVDTYTTAIFFTVDNIYGSCLIICLMQSNPKSKSITISPTTSTPTSTEYHDLSPTIVSTSPLIPTTIPTPTTTPTTSPTATPDTTETPECTCSGVLGIYRITLWIIVLTLTILSMAIT